MSNTSIISPLTRSRDYTDKGHEFEKFIVSRFNPAYFTLLHWQNEKQSGNVCPLSNHDPHLVYQFNLQDKTHMFSIECKFREKDYRNKFTWAEPYQLRNYKRFQEQTKMPLFVVIGLGGLPSKPTNMYLIPFNDIEDTTTLKLTRIMDNERTNTATHFFFDPLSGMLK
ncbi:MAG: hypothetical protein ABIQ88_09055 [Chitinophagaceae bacterium]